MNVNQFILRKQKNFPPNSRVWVYSIGRKLNVSEKEILGAELEAFTSKWAAHGTSLKASFGILYSSLVVLIVDEEQQGASGCSIDSSVHFIKDAGRKLGFNAFDRNVFPYLCGEELKFTSIFNSQVATGCKAVNLSVSSFSALQNSLFLDFHSSSYARLGDDSGFSLTL